jgi:hypothetical protein
MLQRARMLAQGHEPIGRRKLERGTVDGAAEAAMGVQGFLRLKVRRRLDQF